MTLQDQIHQGESKTLELKASLPKGEQIAITVIAFANSGGGKLVIGVNDERQIIGINEDDIFALKDKIASLIVDRVQPPVLPDIYTANAHGKLLLVVEVFRGNMLPYHLKSKGLRDGTYLRIGASNRKADLLHILELERQRANQSFDEEIYPEQTIQALDLTPLQKRFTNAGKTLDQDKMKNLKLIRREQGQFFPTWGLMVLLSELPHVAIKCARFKGTDMSLFLDRKEYTGDLFSQLEQAEAFIKNHLHLRGEIKGLQRTDTYELPDAALREALINALIHRDYTNQGRDIKVGIYDDIVNIVSPVGFPNTLTAADLSEGRSEIHNRVIARVFKELGYIEQWGSGLQRIKASCVDMGLQEPQIREQGDFVDVVFSRPISEGSGKVSDKYQIVSDTHELLSDHEQRVIDHLASAGKVTSKDVERLTGLKEARARRILKEMTDKGLLIKRGSARSTFYVKAP